MAARPGAASQSPNRRLPGCVMALPATWVAEWPIFSSRREGRVCIAAARCAVPQVITSRPGGPHRTGWGGVGGQHAYLCQVASRTPVPLPTPPRRDYQSKRPGPHPAETRPAISGPRVPFPSASPFRVRGRPPAQPPASPRGDGTIYDRGWSFSLPDVTPRLHFKTEDSRRVPGHAGRAGLRSGW